jgi:hypothetical protein
MKENSGNRRAIRSRILPSSIDKRFHHKIPQDSKSATEKSEKVPLHLQALQTLSVSRDSYGQEVLCCKLALSHAILALLRTFNLF